MALIWKVSWRGGITDNDNFGACSATLIDDAAAADPETGAVPPLYRYDEPRVDRRDAAGFATRAKAAYLAESQSKSTRDTVAAAFTAELNRA